MRHILLNCTFTYDLHFLCGEFRQKGSIKSYEEDRFVKFLLLINVNICTHIFF